MSIIQTLRQLLHLDKATVSFEPGLVDSVGMYIGEWHFYEVPIISGCFGSLQNATSFATDYSFSDHHHQEAFPSLHM